MSGQAGRAPSLEAQAARAGNRFRTSPRPRPWVIAHRGDSFHAPENTLEAAQRAWDLGADAWELDVRLSRDRVPVLLHDRSLLRTTNVAQQFAGDPRARDGFLVDQFDLAEIQSLDAGRWFLDPAGPPRSAVAFGTLEELSEGDRAWYASGEVKVPTLADALALTERLDWMVNVELKACSAQEPELLDVVLAAVAASRASDRVEISSFDHADVAEVVRRAPEISTGVLVSTPLYQPQRYVRELVGADAYHPSAGAIAAAQPRLHGNAHSDGFRIRDLNDLAFAGVPVYVYTVNDMSDGGLADRLARVGVAGVFTDDPRSLEAHWGRRPPRGAPGRVGTEPRSRA